MSDFINALGEINDPFFNDVYLLMILMEAIICLDDEANDTIRDLRLGALHKAYQQAMAFRKEGMLTKVVGQMLKKKIDFVMESKSKTQIAEIFKPLKPYHTGIKLEVDHPYWIPEEELMCWSMASLKQPLNHYAVERMMEVFQIVFNCTLDEYLERMKKS